MSVVPPTTTASKKGGRVLRVTEPGNPNLASVSFFPLSPLFRLFRLWLVLGGSAKHLVVWILLTLSLSLSVAAWRLPIGDSGILDFFLSIIAIENLRLSLRVHALRLIGNSCADTGKSPPPALAVTPLHGG